MKVVELDTKKPDVCQFCGGEHREIRCLRVKSLEVDEDGAVVFVEFFPPEVWKPRA